MTPKEKEISMQRRHAEGWSRREFLGGLVLAGAAGLLLKPEPVAAEPPPETTTLRLPYAPAPCTAPQYVAEELLRSEGFTAVQYVKETLGRIVHVAAQQADIGITFAGPIVLQLDAADPIVVLAGVHPGCFELFGTDKVRTIRDLRGKTVGVVQMESSQHIFLAAMAAYVGLDPRNDINWVVISRPEAAQLLAEGKIDAYMGFPPEPQELRAKKIGHVVVNSAMDRPWSQYFCCMVAAHREFVQRYPVATKRALRAILKSVNVCALEPERVARSIVDRGIATSYEYAVQAYKEIPYLNAWHEFNPEDTVRFYALRLYEAGMIKSSPQKIIAEGTDWRFLNELKKELKG
jgi:NitT/TauT family transport system substrate-binding protein